MGEPSPLADSLRGIRSAVWSYTGRLVLSEEERLTLALLLCTCLFRMALPVAAAIAAFLYIAIFHGDFWYRSYLTLNRDLSGLLLIVLIKIDLWRRLSANEPLQAIWRRIVLQHPTKMAMIDIETGRSYTFEEFDSLINRYAHFFQSIGLRGGDCVALFMENSTDFVAAWMGAAKVGVITAWVNSNLKSGPLAHCIETSKARHLLTSHTLQHVVSAAMKNNELAFSAEQIYVLGASTEFVPALERITSAPIVEPTTADRIDFKSILCFIYTSGTTGMPKAAVMKHFRYYSMVAGAAMSFGIRPSHRIYVSMPIYHTAAGILGVGQTIVRGSCCVIRKKFSASNFWNDCVKYDCTASQYIGEICRYLLAQPVVTAEKIHHMDIMYGNGLRAEIWQPFVKRFRVRIGEVYGSTEGTSSLVNTDGHVGACGFLPISPLTKKMHPVRLVKVDDETGEILRRPDGLCVPCQPGETGAMVSTIRKNNPLLQFEGYLNKHETSKKILKNVFSHGDSCFLTGDLLHWDRLGYVYFKDRTGDTYRWKGENVSTTEVEAVVHPLEGVADAISYGVHVPGCEGRAGMLAVVWKNQAEGVENHIENLCARLQASLAPYALPLFIRICVSVDKTGTFKLVKTKLQRQGYSLEHGRGTVFVFNHTKGQYAPLTEQIKEQIDCAQFSL